MDIDAVVDRETLEAYLDGLPDSRGRAVSLEVGFREVARFAPLALYAIINRRSNGKDGVAQLPIFGALLIASLSSYITPRSGRMGSVSPLEGALNRLVVDSMSSDIIHGSRMSTRAIQNLVKVVNHSGSIQYTMDQNTNWGVIQTDLRNIRDGNAPTPLWLGKDAPKPIANIWSTVREGLLKDPLGTDWTFWITWYERVLAGKDMHADALAPILNEITEEDWLGDPTPVTALFDGVLEVYRAEGVGKRTDISQAISRAIEKTPHGEFIEPDPVSGKLIVVADTDIPEDVASYSAHKIERALKMFGTALDNQYSAMKPELELLQDALGVQPRLPVELFDACVSAANRVQMRCGDGSLPEASKDPLIADFLTQIRNAAADIVGHDTKTQDMIAARNNVLGNDALIEAKQDVLEGVAAIVPSTEGVLQADIVADATIATDAAANPEEKKNRTYRLVSRVVKIAGLAIGGGAALGASIFAIIDSPAANALFQAALRWLGLL